MLNELSSARIPLQVGVRVSVLVSRSLGNLFSNWRLFLKKRQYSSQTLTAFKGILLIHANEMYMYLLSFFTRDWSKALSFARSPSSSAVTCWSCTFFLMSSTSWLIDACDRSSDERWATLLANVTTWDSRRTKRLFTALFEHSERRREIQLKSLLKGREKSAHSCHESLSAQYPTQHFGRTKPEVLRHQYKTNKTSKYFNSLTWYLYFSVSCKSPGLLQKYREHKWTIQYWEEYTQHNWVI